VRRASLLLPALVGFGLSAVTAVQAKDFPKRVPDGRARGEELYNRHCVACHGDQGAGDGPMTAALVAEVPTLAEALPEPEIEALVPSVMVGKGAMPGFARAFEDLYPHGGDFKDAARDVLRYMKSLSGEPVQVEPEGPITQEEVDEEAEAARD